MNIFKRYKYRYTDDNKRIKEKRKGMIIDEN